MRTFSFFQTRWHPLERLRSITARLRMLLALSVVMVILNASAFGQSAWWVTPSSSQCSRDNAIEIVEQQIDATKTFDESLQRITVLNRSADLLWPYKQGKARATFSEALDLAAQDFQEKGDQPKREGRGMLVETPDQRYVVIRAIAKRDLAWAKKLTAEMLKKDRQNAEESVTKNPQTDVRIAEKLLDSASSLLSYDINAASNFATASLGYPASIRLTAFMYKLAEVDRATADQFYKQALAVYGNKPVREFLYLTAYPFGLSDSGDMPWTGSYNVPSNFVPNGSLQRLFVQTLLRRAQLALQIQLDEGDNYNGFPGTGHILQQLTRIEPQVQTLLPDLLGEVEKTRTNLLASLTPETQSIFLRPNRNQDSAPKETFDQRIEEAEREPNVNKRDELIVTAILNAGQSESVDHVVNATDKIADSNVRPQLLDWVYFVRTQKAIKDKQLDQAKRLASKVQEIDQRAYLHSEIAKESLEKIENQNQARELLEEIVNTASKAPNTVVAARTLLAAAYLYLKIDPGRSIAILGDAIKRINGMESPDFTKQSQTRKIEGRNFARYALFRTPGFDPENAFREVGRISFDDALSQVTAFTDKSLRALTTLVLADLCLQRVEQQEKADRSKKKTRP